MSTSNVVRLFQDPAGERKELRQVQLIVDGDVPVFRLLEVLEAGGFTIDFDAPGERRILISYLHPPVEE